MAPHQYCLGQRKRSGEGLGTRLLALAEEEGIKRGCISAYLDSMSFQAPDFYLKRGYEIWGELEDFPVGHRRTFLQKKLAGGEVCPQG